MKQLDFKPYRGELEPIFDFVKAQIIFNDKTMELIQQYKFTRQKNQVRTEDYVRAATVFTKNMNLDWAACSHADDPKEIKVPADIH